MSDCIFCKIVAGQIPANEVHADDQCVAFRDVNPQAPVHVLIVPRRHYTNVLDAVDDPALIAHLHRVAVDVARQDGIADSGFRLVFNCNRDGGQSVDHLHLHLLGGRTLTWPPG